MYKMVTYELRRAQILAHSGRALARRIASILQPQLEAVKTDLQDLPGSWLELAQLALVAQIEKDADHTTTAEKALVAERRKESCAGSAGRPRSSSTSCCSESAPSWKAP